MWKHYAAVAATIAVGTTAAALAVAAVPMQLLLFLMLQLVPVNQLLMLLLPSVAAPAVAALCCCPRCCCCCPCCPCQAHAASSDLDRLLSLCQLLSISDQHDLLIRDLSRLLNTALPPTVFPPIAPQPPSLP